MAERTLWLLRHAKTVTDPPKGGDDFDRVLAPRGRRDATALAAELAGDRAGLGLAEVPLPELVLVSPAARTRATAELALAELAAPPQVEFVDDLYGADPEEVLALLQALPVRVRRVMVIGHNPTMHALSQGLISADDADGRSLAARRGFPTCALGVYRFDVQGWRQVAAKTATVTALIIPPYAKAPKG
jgi:phosphohistidine phosphatase